MVEFSEVMRQWKRMCNSLKNCEDCPIAVDDIDGGYMCMNGIAAFDYEAAERTVMTWAGEHPEPVYPTWAEWLIENGLLYACDSPYMKHWYVINQSGIEKPIPADIAQKLGIEPEGGDT